MISTQEKYVLRQLRRLGVQRGGTPVPRSSLLDAGTLEADLVERLGTLEAASLVVATPPVPGEEDDGPGFSITPEGEQFLAADAG